MAFDLLRLEEKDSVMLKPFFADLHIHIGRDHLNQPVKITGSKELTLTKILQESSRRKGLDLIGIVDCHVPTVQDEIKQLLATKQATALEQGGILFESVTLILGVELEIYDQNCQGPIHVLCYFPHLEVMAKFTEWLSTRMKNIQLSSQRIYTSAHELQHKVKELSGLFIPAHIFTPFKSLFGKGVNQSLTEVFLPELIDAVELGLSSDTLMADQISELHDYPFLTNSDAHSLIKIAREYQAIQMEACHFADFVDALQGRNGRCILANYGMQPQLGKYYQSICKYCGERSFRLDTCLNCQRKGKIKGVSERIEELKGEQLQKTNRPPYHYHVPLDYINGLGKRTYEKLLEHFGTEMSILHDTPIEDISDLVGERIANQLIKIRSGEVGINKGGGGKYGTIIE